MFHLIIFTFWLACIKYNSGSVAQWIARRTSSWLEMRYSEAVGSRPTGVVHIFLIFLHIISIKIANAKILDTRTARASSAGFLL